MKNAKQNSFMRNTLVATLAAFSMSAVATEVTAHELCEGFVPPNTMKIPVGNKKGRKMTGLTEEQFNKVIDRVEAIYKDEVAKQGGNLKVNRRWSDPTVNASAQQFGREWIVNMYGGLARHEAITEEGFALVACHEVGHHIGGAPKISDWFGTAWATNEGGSDYFATLKCLRRFYADNDNAGELAGRSIDPFADEKCKSQFTDEKDQLLCQRGVLAGMSVATLFQSLRNETKKPEFNTPDSRVVNRMDDAHPATQCRLDTYFAGAICPVKVDVPLSNANYRDGSCAAPQETLGVRPRCWFKASDDGDSAPPSNPGNEDSGWMNKGKNSTILW